MSEVTREHLCHARPVWGGMAGTYNGNQRQLKHMHVAAEPEHCGRIKNFTETFGICVISVGKKLPPGLGKSLELLICRCPCVALSDEMHALNRKFQSFKVCETACDHFCGRSTAPDCTPDASWTELRCKSESKPCVTIFSQGRKEQFIGDCSSCHNAGWTEFGALCRCHLDLK